MENTVQKLPEVALALLPALGRMVVAGKDLHPKDMNVIIQDVAGRRLLWATNNVTLCTLDLGPALGAEGFCLSAYDMKDLKLPKLAKDFSIEHLDEVKIQLTVGPSRILLAQENSIREARDLSQVTSQNHPMAEKAVFFDPAILASALSFFTLASKYEGYKFINSVGGSGVVSWASSVNKANLLTLRNGSAFGEDPTGKISVWFMPIRYPS